MEMASIEDGECFVSSFGMCMYTVAMLYSIYPYSIGLLLSRDMAVKKCTLFSDIT